MNADLFGHAEPSPVFKDIRPTRPSVAEKKASLALELNRLCSTPPQSLNSASVNRVRDWKVMQSAALKVLRSRSSSCMELQSAINNMRSYD